MYDRIRYVRFRKGRFQAFESLDEPPLAELTPVGVQHLKENQPLDLDETTAKTLTLWSGSFQNVVLMMNPLDREKYPIGVHVITNPSVPKGTVYRLPQLIEG